MYNICIFSGTTEGRKLAEFLSEQQINTTACVATEYAIENGVAANANDTCAWWLRSMGDEISNYAYVLSGGGIGFSQQEITLAVRPAMWIKGN